MDNNKNNLNNLFDDTMNNNLINVNFSQSNNIEKMTILSAKKF